MNKLEELKQILQAWNVDILDEDQDYIHVFSFNTAEYVPALHDKGYHVATNPMLPGAIRIDKPKGGKLNDMETPGLRELNSLVWNHITLLECADATHVYYKVPMVKQNDLIKLLHKNGYTVDTNKDFPYHLRVTIKKGAV